MKALPVVLLVESHASDGQVFADHNVSLIGRFGAALFALGIVEAGMVASATISISSAHAFGEVARRPHSLKLPVGQGKAFLLGVVPMCGNAGAMVLIRGLPLVYVVLLVNVVAVLAMPALVFLFMLANDREVMGDLVSPRWANILVTSVVVF